MSLVVQISEAVDKFLEYQKVRKGRTNDTINTYRSVLGQFVRFTGDIAIDELTIDLIDQYADTLGGYAPKTLRNKLTPIRSLVSYLYAKDKTTMRKESIDLPTIKEIEANFLTIEEQQRLLNACKDLRERAIIAFLLRSGLRVSEFINVRTEDIYERSVLVRRSKGGKPRTTYINVDAQNALDAYHASLMAEPFYLFQNEQGERLSRQYINKLIKRVALRAGFTKKVSPHTMRHTFATNLLIAGARVEDVQQMMGHASIRTTLIYLHFTNKFLKQQHDDVSQRMIAFA